MGQQLALSLLLAISLACAVPQAGMAAGAADGPRWESLSPDLQQVLKPVAGDWPTMPGYQRQRLVNAASHFRQLTPVEQQRFIARLPDWARLPHDTRSEVRDTFRKYHALPTEKREALKQRFTRQVTTPPVEASADSAVPADGPGAARPATTDTPTPPAAAAASRR